jgi:TorA maturation chaperone TorD
MSDATGGPDRALSPEDRARADFYALLSRLFAAAPDAALLEAIATAPSLPSPTFTEPGAAAELAPAWDALREASGRAEPEAIADEFVTLFVGVGRSEVSLYGTHYLGPRSERPLAELRTELMALGLSRRSTSSEFEDHLALMLETMRILAEGSRQRPPAAVDVQRSFFDRHLAPWVFVCCDAIRASAIANYYARVAEFASSFLALERDSFAME